MKPGKKEIEQQVAFLKKWSRRKPINRVRGGGTFWSCGRWLTKIEPDMVKALVDGGHATVLQRGLVDWKKRPAYDLILLGLAPTPDLEGPLVIKMN